MKLILIGTSWCAPCKAAKQILDDKQMDYTYIDGDSEEGMEKALATGARGFPVLIIQKENEPDQVSVGTSVINTLNKGVGL